MVKPNTDHPGRDGPEPNGEADLSLSARFFYWLASALVVAIALVAVSARSMGLLGPETLLGEIRETQRLLVLTRNAPNTFYLEREETAGFEHDLIREFARHVGAKVGFSMSDSLAGLIDGVAGGQAHIAAAAVSADLDLPGALRFGPSYGEIRLQMVCHREGPTPRPAPRLSREPVSVLVEGSFERRLGDMRQSAPDLTWTAIYGPSTEDLMAQVAAREVDCTVGDSALVSVHRRNYPELVVPFDVSGPSQLAWIVPANAHALRAELARWFALASTQELLAQLHERYYGHVPDFDYVDIARFERRLSSRLPKYLPHFERAATSTGLSWRLLAAVAYQESHWRPQATSPTGVRGIMMLTRSTARDLGVENRLDPVQSINGGARYLSRLIERVPESVTGQDRLWFALAAYNVGFGHVMDARTLARRQGLNPDLWSDIKTTLPLLRKKAYYKTVPHGYARGSEPVHYVRQVRHYLDILERWQGHDV